MKVEVNVTKKYFVISLGFLLILASLFSVYAAITTDKPNPGHNINEIGGVDCIEGQALTRVEGTWKCVDLSTGTVESQSSNLKVVETVFFTETSLGGYVQKGANGADIQVSGGSLVITEAHEGTQQYFRFAVKGADIPLDLDNYASIKFFVGDKRRQYLNDFTFDCIPYRRYNTESGNVITLSCPAEYYAGYSGPTDYRKLTFVYKN